MFMPILMMFVISCLMKFICGLQFEQQMFIFDFDRSSISLFMYFTPNEPHSKPQYFLSFHNAIAAAD